MFPAGKIVAPNDRAGLPLARLEAVPFNDDVRILARSAAGAVAGLAEEWTALAARVAEPNAFSEHWFAAASLASLAGRRDIALLEARRGDRLIGILPLALERTYARLPVVFAQNWCHHQMFLGTPLVEAGEEQSFWAAALSTLDELDWAPNFLHLRGLAEDGPVHRGLKAAAAALGPQSLQLCLLDSTERMRARPRPATAVVQTRCPFGPEPRQPLVRRALAHPSGSRCSDHLPALLQHPADQQGSTNGRQSRMLVAVHPSSGLGPWWSRQPQLHKSRTDEQPTETSHLATLGGQNS